MNNMKKFLTLLAVLVFDFSLVASDVTKKNFLSGEMAQRIIGVNLAFSACVNIQAKVNSGYHKIIRLIEKNKIFSEALEQRLLEGYKNAENDKVLLTSLQEIYQKFSSGKNGSSTLPNEVKFYLIRNLATLLENIEEHIEKIDISTKSLFLIILKDLDQKVKAYRKNFLSLKSDIEELQLENQKQNLQIVDDAYQKISSAICEENEALNKLDAALIVVQAKINKIIFSKIPG